MAAAALLEAEIVIADGSVKIVNAKNYPDLFWALKGGSGGSFGVVTKLTLKTRELPNHFGAVFGKIKATDSKSFKKLIFKLLEQYRMKLFDPHWGESVSFQTDNSVSINMVFQGLDAIQAKTLWQVLENFIKASPQDYLFEITLPIMTIPAKHLWDADFLRNYAPNIIATDDRLQAPAENIYWASNKQESGQFLYGYHSTWLPATLLQDDTGSSLTDAIFSASRSWTTSISFNKGLAGAPSEEIEAVKNTSTNAAVLSAFALLIIAGEGEPAFQGIPMHETDPECHKKAEQVSKAMDAIYQVMPSGGSYLSESNFFQKNWQQSFWGTNYEKLAAVKTKYDPEGLFFVRNGVGSENWTDDGFTKRD